MKSLPARNRVQLEFKKPSRTLQYFKEECDTNLIMQKYQKLGIIEHVNKNQPQYGDFSQIPNYQEALHKISAAQESFMNLPSSIRARFKNDAGAFVAFSVDEANHSELVKMGLAHEKKSESKDSAPKEPSTAPTA